VGIRNLFRANIKQIQQISPTKLITTIERQAKWVNCIQTKRLSCSRLGYLHSRKFVIHQQVNLRNSTRQRTPLIWNANR